MVLELLAHDELVLVDDAGALARDVGGGDVGEPLEVPRGAAEVEHVAGAVDVDALGDLERHREVVDRGEVEDAPDLAGQALVVGGLEAEPAVGDVAGDELDPLRRRSPSATAGAVSSIRGSTSATTLAFGSASSSAATRRRPMKPGKPVTSSVIVLSDQSAKRGSDPRDVALGLARTPRRSRPAPPSAHVGSRAAVEVVVAALAEQIACPRLVLAPARMLVVAALLELEDPSSLPPPSISFGAMSGVFVLQGVVVGEAEQRVGAAADDHVVVEAAVEDVDAVVDDRRRACRRSPRSCRRPRCRAPCHRPGRG